MFKKSILVSLVISSWYSAPMYKMDFFPEGATARDRSDDSDDGTQDLTVQDTFAASLELSMTSPQPSSGPHAASMSPLPSLLSTPTQQLPQQEISPSNYHLRSRAGHIPSSPLPSTNAALTVAPAQFSAISSSSTHESNISQSDHSNRCPLGCVTRVNKNERKHAIRHIFTHFKQNQGIPEEHSFASCYECSCGSAMTSYKTWVVHVPSCEDKAARCFLNPKAEAAACQVLGISVPQHCQVAACRQMFTEGMSQAQIANHYRTHHKGILPDTSILSDAASDASMHDSLSSDAKKSKRKAQRELERTTKRRFAPNTSKKNKKAYICEKCEGEFDCLSMMHAMSHLEDEKQVGKNLYECTECVMEFQTRGKATEHVTETHHKTRIKTEVNNVARSLFIPATSNLLIT